MKRAIFAGAALVTVIVLVAIRYRAHQPHVEKIAATVPASSSPAALPPEAVDPSFLYGRITTVDDANYEGRLRWGGSQEAFWGDYFNGTKTGNSWAAYVPPERLPKERRPFEIFGLQIAQREYPIHLGRLFMARFGDIARIEARGRDVRVTLKSGTTFDLDRFSASDFDDGLRVWDGSRGVVNLDSLRIHAIDLLPAPGRTSDVQRLHGTVRTRNGRFTGFLQWNREECIGSDELDGRTAGGDLSLRFSTIRSIARRSPDSSLVTLIDGRQVELSGTREAGSGHGGIYVDDARYGRVLVTWEAFEHVEFSPGGSGPAYGDYPRGAPLVGRITTRDGRSVAGRLVFDLDESELTETLDARYQGVDYTIPFGLVASIVLPPPEAGAAQNARITLHSGEHLELERTGDLGRANAGLLAFADGSQRPEYVPWIELQRIDLNRPNATYPPIARR